MKNDLVKKLDFMVPVKTVSEMNNRDHWGERLKRKRTQQEETFVAMHQVLNGRRVQLPCTVKLTRVGPKKLDDDNLRSSLEFCRDRVAQSLGVDDGDDQVTWEYSQMPVGVREYGVKGSIESA